MSILRKILFPFAILYGVVMYVRNLLYDSRILKTVRFDFSVICVGNLSFGGTGKTPMIEYLLEYFQKNYTVATLSRGYGRKTSGFMYVSGNEKATEVGDEPLQFKRKYKEAIVAVDEKRVRGLNIINQDFSPDVVLLDDAFQHRKVEAGLNILLTSYGDLYSNSFMMPTGNLREFPSGAKRAAIIIVTKCPENLSDWEQDKIKMTLDIQAYQKLFFSYIEYDDYVVNNFEKKPLKKLSQENITLVTGIANPTPLVLFLEKAGIAFTHYKFPDHHNFTSEELNSLKKAPFILTTEKDFMRLKNTLPVHSLYFLPIKMKFLKNNQDLENELELFIKKN